jgi:hypothetical protein
MSSSSQPKNSEFPSVAVLGEVAAVTTVDNNDILLLQQVTTLLGLPVPLRIYILNYLLGETQEELMINLTLVSKQIYKDCKRPGIEWKIIPTIL